MAYWLHMDNNQETTPDKFEQPNLPEDLSKFASAFARMGGNATKKKYGKEHYSRMGKKGMFNRWHINPDEALDVKLDE